MDTQIHRRHNLARLLSLLELDGIDTIDAQAHAIGHIVTAHKLGRMILGSDVPCLVARGIEHVFGVPKGWLDAEGPNLALARTPGVTPRRPTLAPAPAIAVVCPPRACPLDGEAFIHHPPLYDTHPVAVADG